jgi:hypothetical protein
VKYFTDRPNKTNVPSREIRSLPSPRASPDWPVFPIGSIMANWLTVRRDLAEVLKSPTHSVQIKGFGRCYHEVRQSQRTWAREIFDTSSCSVHLSTHEVTLGLRVLFCAKRKRLIDLPRWFQTGYGLLQVNRVFVLLFWLWPVSPLYRDTATTC